MTMTDITDSLFGKQTSLLCPRCGLAVLRYNKPIKIVGSITSAVWQCSFCNCVLYPENLERLELKKVENGEL